MLDQKFSNKNLVQEINAYLFKKMAKRITIHNQKWSSSHNISMSITSDEKHIVVASLFNDPDFHLDDDFGFAIYKVSDGNFF